MCIRDRYNGNKVKFIQLSQLDDGQLLAVIVMEANVVKNKIIPLDAPLDNEDVYKRQASDRTV